MNKFEIGDVVIGIGDFNFYRDQKLKLVRKYIEGYFVAESLSSGQNDVVISKYFIEHYSPMLKPEYLT